MIEAIVAIAVALLSLIGNFIGSWLGNSKTQALIEYRLTMLEAKVDKHNQVVERTYQLEKDKAVMQEQLANTQEQLANMEEALNDMNRRIVNE